MAYQTLLTDAEMIQISFWFLVAMGLSGFVFDFIRKIWRHFRKPAVTGNPDVPETKDPANA